METRKKIINNLRLRSESVQKILTTPPHWTIRWGNTVFLILLLLVLMTCYLIKYPESVKGPIKITVQDQTEILHANNAKTGKDLIKNNQQISVSSEKRENLIGRIAVPSSEIHKIKQGQKVIIRLKNNHYNKYEVTEGTVNKIISDSNKNYYAEVVFPEKLNGLNHKNYNLKNELHGEAEIVTNNSRLINKFFHKIK